MSARRLLGGGNPAQMHRIGLLGLRPPFGTGEFGTPAAGWRDSGVYSLLFIAADGAPVVCQSHRRDTSP